ncbi:hypothetical protein WMY93_011813 [Mugilogobius chulae]|uniref:G-protein coupled receptors family 1 profile domain-containing protein n=1 Tax=Mugilogobius chulae TaxID=88201 RepID=A0AAW0P746_9GOBI
MKLVWWTLVLVLVSGEDIPDGFMVIKSPLHNTTLRESQLHAVQSWSLVLLLPLVKILVLVLALPANLLALWILLFRSKRMPSTVLLINLTVCDLLLLLALPFRAVYHFSGNDWRLGEPLCRLVVALFYGNMYGSVLCLAFIAVDRYVALVHPFGAKVLRSRRTSLLMMMAVWLVVAVAMLPLLLMKQTFDLDEPRITMCHDALPQSELETFFRPYFLCLFCVCFAVPLFTLLFCHGAILRSLMRQGERFGHAIRATVLVLTVFIVCFVPSNILLLLSLWDEGEEAEPDKQVPYMLSLALSAFNTVLDPFIYYYICSDFRDKALSVLCCWSQHTAADRSSSGQKTSSERQSSSENKTKLSLLCRSQPTNQSTDV